MRIAELLLGIRGRFLTAVEADVTQLVLIGLHPVVSLRPLPRELLGLINNIFNLYKPHPHPIILQGCKIRLLRHSGFEMRVSYGPI